MTNPSRLAETARLIAEGRGDRFIKRHFNLSTRDAARRLIREAEKWGAPSTVVAVVEPDPKTAADFAARITSCWRKSAEAFIEAGRWLIRAKNELEHGDFGEMISSDLPFGARTAQRLMAIAGDARLTNATHASHLPPHWPTLYEITKLPDEDFEAKIADGTINPDMERRAISTAIKQQQRTTRERVLGGIQCALPIKKYGVILGDPEWRFEPWSRATGLDRAADNHYPTSCTEIIAARDVPSIAAPDCVLFLWATNPMLPHALLVMAAWGFDYKSNYAWGKDKSGTGYWNREKHELLLIGTKGNIPCPAPGTQWDSLIMATRGAHSEKPDTFLEMIERYFPTLPKIELNRRGQARAGWDAWGNEAEAATTEAA